MAYIMLGAAIALEVLGTSLLPSTQGFSRLGPTLLCLSSYAAAFILLSRIVEYLPVGVVYATWSGMGIAAIMLIGATFLGEPLTLAKLAGAAMIIGGVVILNVAGVH
ncbi:multidrug efflux SMR transporter [Kineosporia rhizophila]|uniref:DMT family transporter n=1 Tax=Kineosporia TaxID=49184 RepID=UPI001E5EFD20|nr:MULTISPECIES: multidrug efflux SMR transporter [Kineosporia]MCE0536873.1 multidrug efflux SMR transporter [Kineosporia rhizophila]GLY19028.1 multidrug transporter [Kineosporia sp. NBRC 101677]